MPVEVEVQQPRWRASLGDRANEALADDLRRWITSEPLAILARAWGEEPPNSLPLTELFAWFDALSARHWDFRRGAERNLATDAKLSPGQEELVKHAAHQLGMVEAKPPSRRSYDYVLVLGGLIRACFVRPRYAAHLAASGVEFGRVVALGGFRPIGGDEFDLASHLKTSAANEFDAMLEGVIRAFALDSAPVIAGSKTKAPGNADWRIAEFKGHPPIEVIAAPSSEPSARRANTVDSYDWWARRGTGLEQRTVLLVTSTIYVPYQEAGGIEVLGMRYGADVETVGVPSQLAKLGPHSQKFSAGNYLQEIRSAIRGYGSLAARLRLGA